jgi:hypothetical protein
MKIMMLIEAKNPMFLLEAAPAVSTLPWRHLPVDDTSEVRDGSALAERCVR